MNRLWVKLTTSVAGGAVIIGTSTIVSKLLGLLRNRLLASQFGAGETLDAYFAAFRLPDFVFNILVLGALSSAFIPVFIEYWKRHENGEVARGEVWGIASGVLNALTVALLVLGAFLAVFARPLMGLVAPGFDAETLALSVHMTRIMLLAILFFAVSNVLSGILNAFRRFVAYSLAPVFYNIGIIVGIVAFVPLWGVIGLAWGVVLGALLHMLVQLPAVFRTGFRYMRGFRLRHPGVRKIATLMLPRTLGLGVFQLNQVVITAIASTIATGSIAVFTLAFDVVSVPINVFGISLAVAAFPVFSRAAAEKDTQAFVAHFSTNVRRVLFLLLPTSVLFLMLRAQLVRVLYGAGEFGWDATYLTAQAVAYFSISLLAQSLIPLLARSFYAYQDTKTPVFVSIGSVALNIVLGIFFSRSFGILGLVAAFSFAAVLQMLVLLVLLRIRIGDLDDRRILFSFARILFASAGMGLVVWGMKWFVAAHVDMQTFAGILTQGAAAGAVGVLAYLLFAVLLRAEEVRLLSQWINKTRNFLRNGRH